MNPFRAINRCLPAVYAAICLLPLSATAGLDFKLQHTMSEADAIPVDKPYITDGPSKIYLQFLGNWRVTDSADALEFTPGMANSRVRLGRYKATELTIDDAGGRNLLQQVMTDLPKGATNITTLPIDYDPLPIFGWHDLQVTVRYDFFGQTLRYSVMYIRMLPRRLVEFSVTAADADFDKVYKPARAILGSWFEPSRDLPPDLAQKYQETGNLH